VVNAVLLRLELKSVAGGWQVWVSLLASVVWFWVKLVLMAVGWRLWVSLVVGGVMFNAVFIVGVVG
jgi:hypothetical protein